MFGIGMPEAILIAIVALLVVGPKKLPELARTLGKGLNEFRRTASDVTDGFKETIKADEIKDEIKKDVESVKTAFLYEQNEQAATGPATPVPPASDAQNPPASTIKEDAPKS